MKKLLVIGFLSLLLSENAYAEPTKFKCINNDGKEREYVLSIDLKKKLIKRAGIPYEIIIVDENTIAATNETAQFSNLINFQRYTGDMDLQIYWKKPPEGQARLKEIVYYSCKLMKKLI